MPSITDFWSFIFCIYGRQNQLYVYILFSVPSGHAYSHTLCTRQTSHSGLYQSTESNCISDSIDAFSWAETSAVMFSTCEGITCLMGRGEGKFHFGDVGRRVFYRRDAESAENSKPFSASPGLRGNFKIPYFLCVPGILCGEKIPPQCAYCRGRLFLI